MVIQSLLHFLYFFLSIYDIVIRDIERYWVLRNKIVYLGPPSLNTTPKILRLNRIGIKNFIGGCGHWRHYNHAVLHIFKSLLRFPQEKWDWVLCHACQDWSPSLHWQQHWTRHSLRQVLPCICSQYHWSRWFGHHPLHAFRTAICSATTIIK